VLIKIICLLTVPLFAFAQPNDFLIRKGAVGAIELKFSETEVYRLYGTNLTKAVDLDLEGTESPAILLFRSETEKAQNLPRIIFELDDHLIYRMTVLGSEYETATKIHVGSTVADLRKHYKKIKTFTGEGNVCARIDEIGMSFCLDQNGFPDNWRPGQKLPESAQVSSILVVE
jgi:hypothetical protein